MSDQDLRSDIKALTNSVNVFVLEMQTHIAETKQANIARDKNSEMLMKDMWGTGDENPGVKSKTQTHSFLFKIWGWVTGILATSMLGMAAKNIWAVLTKP